MGQQDLGVGAAALELVDEIGDAADDEVVAEVHDEIVVAEEVARDQDAVRQAERRRLRDVGRLDPERRAVTDRGLDLGVGIAHDDADVGDAGVANRLETVEQHRLVRDRYKLFGRRVGNWAQSGTCAPRQHKSLHAAGGYRSLADGT